VDEGKGQEFDIDHEDAQINEEHAEGEHD